MSYRNRTATYNSLRDQHKNSRPSAAFRKDDGSAEPLNKRDGTSGDIPLTRLNVAPEWIKIHDIDTKLSLLNDKIQKLGKLHATMTEIMFDNDREIEIETEIEVMTKDIATDISKTHNMIKILGEKKNMSGEEVKLRKNIQSAKSKQLHDVSMEFRKKQRAFLNALQKNSKLDAWGDTSQDEPDEEEDYKGFGFTEQQLEVVGIMESEVEQRNAEIKQILRSINDLSAIIQDISMLVIKQGTLLDQIEYNLDQTEANIVEADAISKDANKLHKGYRNRLCILLVLIVLIVAMVFFAIIKAFI
ncbi:hypothetical protein SAMD00019534_056320 [Acytostelium subglobosum LB1]|uniref:hypothetical protein n=1 Tax=Acytostelium subglobosum LB1 TaxID=1410327 RepID=UPI000644D581|nr:hypothetical protein SAMD00019534_056320 [Acytostelium subglobosum LB1]GAM22457.1 hypothetical protein SAMD00019534_056320 [Acytostelium subglobosum LB1]|eukprot:XP_012754577.1 hypothetical protein SAMD00019534_056320 [Acytostelium subglobosum LB1]